MERLWTYRPGFSTCGQCRGRFVQAWLYLSPGGLWCRTCFAAITRTRPPPLLDGQGWSFRAFDQGARHNPTARAAR